MSRLKIHTKRSHSDSAKETVKCEQCEKCFSSKGNLKKHVDNIHEKVNHKCTTCGKNFTSKSSLSTHVNSIHLKKTAVKCDQCHKTFGRKSVLKIHILDVHLKKQICEEFFVKDKIDE